MVSIQPALQTGSLVAAPLLTGTQSLLNQAACNSWPAALVTESPSSGSALKSPAIDKVAIVTHAAADAFVINDMGCTGRVGIVVPEADFIEIAQAVSILRAIEHWRGGVERQQVKVLPSISKPRSQWLFELRRSFCQISSG